LDVSVPLENVRGPLTVRLALSVSVPPLTVRLLAVELLATVRMPPLTMSAPDT
jgi:hypothetical protein